MKILAVETSSPSGSVALLEDELVLAQRSFGEGTRHGRDMLPCIDEVLGGDPGSVNLIAVSAGPGSYTGLRVGMTFAKMFAAESGTPLVSVSSLDVIAANMPDPAWLCVVVDARLGQVYAALYDADRKKVMDDMAASAEDVAAALNAETVVIGDGLGRYREAFAARAKVIDEKATWLPRAVNAGRLGFWKFKRSGGEDPEAVEPRYLRRPQAEVRWEELRSAPGPR